MRIYLVRHGDAVGEELAGSDRDRWLSEVGRDRARRLGQMLRAQQIAIDAILSSPLPRAVQTAELIAQALDFGGAIATRRCLEPGAPPRPAALEIGEAGLAVLVVSHEPTVSTLGAYLLKLPAMAAFRTAQCSAIEHGKATFTARPDTGHVHTHGAD